MITHELGIQRHEFRAISRDFYYATEMDSNFLTNRKYLVLGFDILSR